MCRNIKTLHNFKPPATEAEIRASALQFVRKLSGFARPSKANEPAFQHAVEHVAEAARELLRSLMTNAPPATVRSRSQSRGREPPSATARQPESRSRMSDVARWRPRGGEASVSAWPNRDLSIGLGA